MEALGLSMEMLVVLALLAFTIFLFVSEIVRVDLAAIIVMVLLGILSVIPGLGELADLRHLFDGFASNAVISIIAVMIIGAGLDQTGLMSRVAQTIVKVGGNTEKRLIVIITSTVAFISSFMQNVGATALFLPVVARVSNRTGISMSRLLMPMGFCAILGGTMTMVGSSPLILLNDLILGVNPSLPEQQRMETFGLFAVTPIGVALVLTGIVYFIIAGPWVLKSGGEKQNRDSSQDLYAYFERIYALNPTTFEVVVKPDSPLVGMDILEVLWNYKINIIGIHFKGRTRMEPPPDIKVEAPARLAVIADPAHLQAFIEKNRLEIDESGNTFVEELSSEKSGLAEIVIPPDSDLVGKSAKDVGIRKNYGLSILALFRHGVCYSRTATEMENEVQDDIGKMPFEAGDTLVCHTSWNSLSRLEKMHRKDFVVVTSGYPHDEFRPDKTRHALLFFLLAIGLILFTDIRLSLCLLIGALGMILTNVLSLDEAYESVSWRTVFLLASLIPLGEAVQNTGTAAWIANGIVSVMSGLPILALQAAVAILATAFSLVMSNVGATVLLVPLAVNIALAAGADPALFALTVALATSNSFIIPTHQVNALIMGPGGYRVADFMRAGGIMTVLFLVVQLFMLNLIF
ncbi:MAG TPA: SLC13 family permease [Thiolinea sp.]|nr:SLC13 family permease [Thiolinea sp.]